MTAAFDATRGTGQRFTDALSGSDGTADPFIMMPVLDVYPDALSAPMPVDLVPVVPRVIPPSAAPSVNVRADPGRPAPSQRGATRQNPPRPGQTWQRPAGQPGQVSASRPATTAGRPAQPRPAVPRASQPGPGQPRAIAPSAPTNARRATGQQPASPPGQRPFTWQGMSVSATEVAAMFRSSMPGQSAQVDRESFQATHPQSMGSAAPTAVAPAAPMASQYSGRGAARNTARDQAQERRRVTNTVRRKGSSTWAVIVFLVVIAFATGIGQRIIDVITGLLNR
jgi:hypothetical protein